MSAEPIRTCAGCAERAPKATLLRFVGTADGLAADPDRHALGRGAYLHRDARCFDLFVHRRGPVRSLRRSVGRPERERFVAGLTAEAR
jgi:predicted RNA-binding protein YlxR (DUF448 family)